MLPSSREVEEVLTGTGGMAAALPAGSVVLDCSTSDPASTRKLAGTLAGQKIAFVDAGVTRGVDGAQPERERVGQGKGVSVRVDLGGRRVMIKKRNNTSKM